MICLHGVITATKTNRAKWASTEVKDRLARSSTCSFLYRKINWGSTVFPIKDSPSLSKTILKAVSSFVRDSEFMTFAPTFLRMNNFPLIVLIGVFQPSASLDKGFVKFGNFKPQGQILVLGGNLNHGSPNIHRKEGIS